MEMACGMVLGHRWTVYSARGGGMMIVVEWRQKLTVGECRYIDSDGMMGRSMIAVAEIWRFKE